MAPVLPITVKTDTPKQKIIILAEALLWVSRRICGNFKQMYHIMHFGVVRLLLCFYHIVCVAIIKDVKYSDDFVGGQ